jgi:hypothetical protein
MSGRRFAAEVERNRFISNWAAVYLSGRQEKETELSDKDQLVRLRQWFKDLVAPRSVALGAGLVFLIISLFAQVPESKPATPSINLATSAPPAPVTTPIPMPKSDSAPRCGEQPLNTALDVATASEPTIPPDFSIIGRQQFGGALFMQIKCSESSVGSRYEVEWLLAGGKWQLKQISRLPERQSGDMANSN